MGTVVQASCPGCGPVRVQPADVRLYVSNRAPEASHYLFVCPSCEGLVSKPADPHIIMILTSSGEVAKTYWEPPALLERRPKASLYPLTEDEALDAIMALAAMPDADIVTRCAEAFR